MRREADRLENEHYENERAELDRRQAEALADAAIPDPAREAKLRLIYQTERLLAAAKRTLYRPDVSEVETAIRELAAADAAGAISLTAKLDDFIRRRDRAQLIIEHVPAVLRRLRYECGLPVSDTEPSRIEGAHNE